MSFHSPIFNFLGNRLGGVGGALDFGTMLMSAADQKRGQDEANAANERR